MCAMAGENLERETWLFLTATVNVSGIAAMERVNPAERLGDYIRALRQWMAEPTIKKIVLCENSNYPLDQLVHVAQHENRYDKCVVFRSFDGQSFPRHLGKGYGEMMTLAHIVNSCPDVPETARFLKVNGRYFVRNIQRFHEVLDADLEISAMANMSRALTWSDSRCFGASVHFLRDYLLPYQDFLNDSEGIFFEHVLARAVHRALSDGMKWAPLPVAPVFDGVSGTFGTAYRESWFRRMAKQAYYRVKRYVYLR